MVPDLSLEFGALSQRPKAQHDYGNVPENENEGRADRNHDEWHVGSHV
jgi:hypothetical protein